MVGSPRLKRSVGMLATILIVVGVAISSACALLDTNGQHTMTNGDLGSAELNQVDQTDTAATGTDFRPTESKSVEQPVESKSVEQEELGLPGHPGSIGWELLESKKSNNQISMSVHHVFASDYGAYAVYSIMVEDKHDRFGPDVVTKYILDGNLATEPTWNHLITTDGSVAIGIASLGKPVPDVTTHGLQVTVDTSKGLTNLSIDVMRDETPGVVEKRFVGMRNTDPKIPLVLYVNTGSVHSYSGTTFSVHPIDVNPTENTTTHFLFSPDSGVRKITVEERKAFNWEHIARMREIKNGSAR